MSTTSPGCSEAEAGIHVRQKRGRRWQDVLSVLVFGLHGWVLILVLPRTLWRIAVVLRPGGQGLPDHELAAFGPRDARFRPWYNKIARDYHVRGRFGVAWDDGLGMPLGMRIYNNWATYALLYRLGTRRMILLGYVIMVGVLGILLGSTMGDWGVFLAAVAAGSPLLVISYTHLGKPEVVWWGAALAAITVGLRNPSLGAGLAWSFLAFVNIPVAVMLAGMLGPALLLLSAHAATLPLLLLGCLPGVVKGLIRAWQMWHSGYMTTLTSEQREVNRRSQVITIHELLWTLPFIIAVGLAGVQGGQSLAGVLLAFCGAGLYWANFRLLYMNDPQSFHLAFFAIGIAAAVAWETPVAAIAALAAAYHHPRHCRQPDVPPLIPGEPRWRRLGRVSREMIASYPSLRPRRLVNPPSLESFLSAIPDGSRILAESDGDPRSESAFRGFWTWSEDFLPRRGIDLVNEMYTRLVEPDLADNFLFRFNAEGMSGAEKRSLCGKLGVTYVVAHTATMVRSLCAAGFERETEVDLGGLEEFRKQTRVPAVTLVLLRAPEPTAAVEPARRVVYDGSTLTTQVLAGETCLLRYRFLPEYVAELDGVPVPLSPYQPLPQCKLEFMQTITPRSGELTVRYGVRRFLLPNKNDHSPGSRGRAQ